MAVGLPGDNCVDLYAQDVGLMAICENFQVVGYNVLVGGGMGMTPRREDTFPALAQPLAMVRPEQVVDVVRAILTVFRDFGNRADRRQARLKYLLAAWGLEKFKAQVEARLGYALRRAAAERRLGRRRPRGLARAGRRPLVLRPARRRAAGSPTATSCG